MASALEALTNNYETSSPVSFRDFYNAYGRDHSNSWIDADPYSFGAKFGNLFTGKVSSAEKEYENYLAGYEAKRNANETAKANLETWKREDSQIQRLMEDYQKAGLNPYMLLSGGNLSSGVVSSAAQRMEYKRARQKMSEKKSGSGLGTALKLLAILALKG